MTHRKQTFWYYPLLLLFVLWALKFIELFFDVRFTRLGIYPQQLSGLLGIITAPFIHGSVKHLLSNSLPVFFLISALNYFYPRLSLKIIIWAWLLSGTGVWLGGRFAWHIGISGIIYALASFLFFAGIISKNRRLSVISLLVVFVYGGLIWGIFPNDPNVSWEAHLFGFLSGIILAYWYAPDIKKIDKKTIKKTVEDFTEYDTSFGEMDIHYKIKKEDE